MSAAGSRVRAAAEPGAAGSLSLAGTSSLAAAGSPAGPGSGEGPDGAGRGGGRGAPGPQCRGKAAAGAGGGRRDGGRRDGAGVGGREGGETGGSRLRAAQHRAERCRVELSRAALVPAAAAAAAAEHVGAGGGELPAGEGAVLPAPARPPGAQGKARRHHGLLRHPQDDLLQSEYPAPRVPARGLQCAGTRRGGRLAACVPPARRAGPPSSRTAIPIIAANGVGGTCAFPAAACVLAGTRSPSAAPLWRLRQCLPWPRLAAGAPGCGESFIFSMC